jgi:hypothetical protein
MDHVVVNIIPGLSAINHVLYVNYMESLTRLLLRQVCLFLLKGNDTNRQSMKVSTIDSEANLVIALARAKRDVFRAQKALADCMVKENEVMTSLMKIQADGIEKKVDDADLGLGHMRVIFQKYGLSHHVPVSPQLETHHDSTLHSEFLYVSVAV